MAQDVLATRVQLFSCISVPLRRTMEWIWGQKPLVLVRHHSPQEAQGQLLGIWRSTVEIFFGEKYILIEENRKT